MTQSGRSGSVARLRVLVTAVLVAAVLAPLAGSTPVAGAEDDGGALDDPGELLWSTEGNRLRRYDTDTIGTAVLREEVLIPSAGDSPADGRDVNGEICFLPDGSGRFVAGEDTGQPTPPAGFGIFEADGTQVGKLTPTYLSAGPEPYGCGFAPDGTLFTSDVGFQGFGTANGQLIMWFDPLGLDGSAPTYCKLATDLGTAGAVAVDGEGRVYVAQSSLLSIERFSPPFPTSNDASGGCGGSDTTGAPVADQVQRERFAVPSDGMLTFSGLAFAPNGNLYASSVFTGRIGEYDPDGNLVRLLLAPSATLPPIATGHPQGLAVGGDGTLYYADLDLVGTLPNVGPGPDGRVWRIRFDHDGDPLAPEVVRSGLSFPDGLAIGPGDLEVVQPVVGPWPTLAGGPDRTFFNPAESWLTSETVPQLVEKWRFPTDAVVTSSPSVADIEMGDAGERRVVFATSWDGFFSAIDFEDGSELWRFAWEDQPGSSFPAAGSPTVAEVDGATLVLVAAGEILYAIDAATGAEQWRFTAGTGCRDALTGDPPGLCGFTGERNQIESTPLVVDGTVYVGMDVNDVATGKGGFFALDASDGSMVWYFDVETGATCRPDPGDVVHHFDGYHSEAELGLPAGFFASRAGCDHDRIATGCGNVWSSAAHDPERKLLYFGTSNCDTDLDPSTPAPTPVMPPYDEALVALRVDGTPVWRWRPREVDPDDLAFGAVPNLFSIDVDGTVTDVVGIGGKDGTYYVVDRDGVNARNGVSWDDADPSGLPYWQTNVVPGGAIGGIIATASVDVAARRVYFSTAPGLDVVDPDRPTVHALDLDNGAVVWQHEQVGFPGGDASYGPTSAVPGVVIVGSVITPHLRMFDARDGTLLFDQVIGQPGTVSGIASGAAVVDGTLVVGAGIGARSSGGSSPGDFTANTPSAVIALCVPGAPGCPVPTPTIVPGAVTIDEGDAGETVVEVPVRLSSASPVEVSAAWQVVYGSASADDVVSASGTVVFAPGETTAAVEVTVNGDGLHETDELAAVAFHDPVNAVVGGFYGLGFVTVRDDDPPPKLFGGLSLGVEPDGPGEIRVPVLLGEVSGRSTLVDWATIDLTASAGEDYVAASGTLEIPAGATSGTVRIELLGDDDPERLEAFGVVLSAPVGAELAWPFGVAFVLDDD